MRVRNGLPLCVVLLLAACATPQNYYDPLEPINRRTHAFNDFADRNIAQPVARTYQRWTPEPAQIAVNNFFSNLEDPWVAANSLLQGKGEKATRDVLRFSFNSTFGLFGLIDIATPMGLSKHDEDLGQTLGYWGVGSGPYLVLPLLGPRTLRDSSGTALDIYAGPISTQPDVALRNSLTALRALNTRTQLLAAGEVVDEAALDPYSFVRDGYLQRRHKQIHDGNPPEPLPLGEAFDINDLLPADGKP